MPLNTNVDSQESQEYVEKRRSGKCPRWIFRSKSRAMLRIGNANKEARLDRESHGICHCIAASKCTLELINCASLKPSPSLPSTSAPCNTRPCTISA
ncbi:hypothetical protein N7537_010104 [Penicillium hordei]|uniref:Uncharacterized protein n=1 Tax=Penicillium hordei TaxID=40994 RepID=A0AAD6DUT1_9EURO|nr:uncharacterized protein N7537_010104 [Penicillium hordei]KAJ5593200.1 hypothetical protein N7537_010104 [Penicillium hordei]